MRVAQNLNAHNTHSQCRACSTCDSTFFTLLAQPAMTYRIVGDLSWTRIWTDRQRFGTSWPSLCFSPQLHSQRLKSRANLLKRLIPVQPPAAASDLPTTIDFVPSGPSSPANRTHPHWLRYDGVAGGDVPSLFSARAVQRELNARSTVRDNHRLYRSTACGRFSNGGSTVRAR